MLDLLADQLVLTNEEAYTSYGPQPCSAECGRRFSAAATDFERSGQPTPSDAPLGHTWHVAYPCCHWMCEPCWEGFVREREQASKMSFKEAMRAGKVVCPHRGCRARALEKFGSKTAIGHVTEPATE